MANTIQPLSMTIPNFNGENYDFWSIRMKTFFFLSRHMGDCR